MRRVGLISMLACLCGGAAFADADIGGWAVSAKPNSDGACTATRAYVDKEDDNKKNSVVFGLVKDKAGIQLLVVFGYEDWSFDKDEAVVADLIVDGKTIRKKWKWEGDGKVLTSVFDNAESIVPVFGAGKQVVLHFGKGEDADFQIPNAGLALGAVQLCLGQPVEETKAQPRTPAQTPAPAEPKGQVQPPAQGGTTIGRTALGAGDTPTQVVTFAPDTAKISVFVELLTPKLGDKIEAKWIAVKTAGAAPGYVIDTSVTPVAAGVQEVDSHLSKPTAGWPTGDYKVDVSVNGELAKSVPFSVK